MSKLTKLQIKAHAQSCELLKKDRLTEDDCWFVLENWQESARHVNSAAGAFFTPTMLARDFAIETGGCRTFVDLRAAVCAVLNEKAFDFLGLSLGLLALVPLMVSHHVLVSAGLFGFASAGFAFLAFDHFDWAKQIERAERAERGGWRS